MRPAAVLASGLAIAAFPVLAACDRPASNTEGRGITETTSGNLDIVDARSPEGFLRVKKDYINGMDANIADADRRLGDLDSRAEKIDDGPTRARIKASIRNARAQRDVFRLDVRSLGYEPQATWDTDRADMDKKWDALRTAIDRIDQQLEQVQHP
jgi:hypothetical protein